MRIAEADAFRPSLRRARREALWAIKALRDEPLPLFAAATAREAKTIPELREPAVALRPMTAGVHCKEVKPEHIDFRRRVLHIQKPKGGSKRAFDIPLSREMILCLSRALRFGRCILLKRQNGPSPRQALWDIWWNRKKAVTCCPNRAMIFVKAIGRLRRWQVSRNSMRAFL